MADKALSNPFSKFFRKIGYSVGLEHTLDRIRDFSRLYSSLDSISFSDIDHLLHDEKPSGWGLDRKNNHVLDVLRSLEIVSVKNGDVSVLESGEALGILSLFQESAQFDSSLRFVFTQSLLRADGDIFLNAMAACFDPGEFESRITRLLEFKWSLLESLFQSSQQRAAIYQAVNIEMQENNRGSKGRTGGLTSIREGSPFAPRGSLLGKTVRPEVRVSDAYLRKALPRRKAWAISLGLALPDGALTADGEFFLKTLVDAGLVGPSCMAMWPLAHEVRTPIFAGLSFPSEIPVADSWSFFSLVRHALGGAVGELPIDNQTQDEGLNQLEEALMRYRSLNLSKTIVRSELPARIGYLVILASTDRAALALPVPAIIRAEQEQPKPRLMARVSRLAEFALSD